MQRTLTTMMLIGAMGGGIVSAEETTESKDLFVHPFFAFCMDTHDSMKRDLREQAALLKELGYDGAGHLWLDQVAERIETLDEAGLKLFKISMYVDISAEQPFDTRLENIMPLLKDRGVMLALLMRGMPPSDPAGDPKAVVIIRRIADMARDAGVTVALYPHFRDWLERVEDGVRLAKLVDRPNVGVMFNLCHWLAVDEEKNLDALLDLAMPHLVGVSIHGADRAAEVQAGTGNWIQPLDSGSFDVVAFLNAFRQRGYRGPVGLQCWGIQGDARDHLTRSMAAWRKMSQALCAVSSAEK